MMNQDEMVVAFQGEPGAYSEQAVREHFGAETVSLPCRDFQGIFTAVQNGRATHGRVVRPGLLYSAPVAKFLSVRPGHHTGAMYDQTSPICN
jgi:hypothetical protein